MENSGELDTTEESEKFKNAVNIQIGSRGARAPHIALIVAISQKGPGVACKFRPVQKSKSADTRSCRSPFPTAVAARPEIASSAKQDPRGDGGGLETPVRLRFFKLLF